MIIAVTGYIGVGKTTFSGFLKEDGFEVIDVDSLGHALLDEPSIKDKLVNTFGEQVLGRDLKIERKVLSDIVFNDDSKLDILNNLLHDKLKKELVRQVEMSKDKKVIVDVALFKKLGIDEVADKVILIKADLEDIYTRLQQRYSKRQVLNIMDSQEVPVDFDIEVNNTGTVEDLKRRAKEISMRYLKR